MSAPKGNKNAVKAKVWELAIRHELAKDKERLYRIARNVLKLAEAGESWAVTEVRNTLDGKPKEHIHVEHEDHRISYAERLEAAADSARTPEPSVEHTVQ